LFMSSGQFRGGVVGAGENDSEPESSVGRYGVRIGPRQIRLHAGETIIGRDEACQIVVTGGLVSRRHARIVFECGELGIEDLGSTNGTFLNRAAVHGRVPLNPGDRIFVGSSEIEVVWHEGESPESGTFGDALDRATPSSGVSLAARVAVAPPPDHWGAVTERGVRSALDLEAIESAERLAERMFALGRPLAGRDILSEPLNKLLLLARSGQVPEPEIVDAAGRCAMRLAQEVFDANWINLAVEIHLLADHPMRPETLRQVIALRKKAPIGDDELIARYHSQSCGRMQSMTLGERVLYAELADHIPHADYDE